MIPSNPSEEPVTAHAPVRICDVGGWTDTWFGSPGQVCSLAAGPGVTVRAEAAPREPGIPPAHLVAPDIGVDHRFGPDDGDGWQVAPPGTRSLLECAVAEALSKVDPPASWSATVTITSAVPPGASLGTSASVTQRHASNSG